MYRRFHAGAGPARRRLFAGAALAATLTGGCTQATRHSNMMIFGTNTVVGLSAGKDVDTPAITVGYKRQELVLMPLVANEKENGSRELVPCEMSDAGRDGRAQTDHPCLLAATRSTGEHSVAKDSYSVLASFGANFDSSVAGGQPNAKGGLAQYFATGMAAQLLAVSGGASIVATGSAAEKSAENKPSPAAIAAVTGDATLAAVLADPAVVAKGAALIAGTPAAKSALADWIDALPIDPAARATEVQSVMADLNANGLLDVTCPDIASATTEDELKTAKSACRNSIAQDKGWLNLFPDDESVVKAKSLLQQRIALLKERKA